MKVRKFATVQRKIQLIDGAVKTITSDDTPIINLRINLEQLATNAEIPENERQNFYRCFKTAAILGNFPAIYAYVHQVWKQIPEKVNKNISMDALSKMLG